jgi:hypothetical protein
MRLDEFFKAANAVRWSKRGSEISKKAADRPDLRPRTKFSLDATKGEKK